MKTIALLLVLFSTHVSAVDLIVGGLSRHIGPQSYPSGAGKTKYNSSHDMQGAGFEYGHYYISAINYKNSFYSPSTAISLQYKYKDFYIGATIATGYDEFNVSNIGTLAVYPSIRYPLKYGSIVFMGTAAAFVFSLPVEL